MYTPDQKISNRPTALNKLNDAWNENPLMVIGIATGATMALAKLIDAISAAQGRRAYARQVGLKTKKRQ
jgi:hypoxanthine-guanine phosphoribosyltransferase